MKARDSLLSIYLAIAGTEAILLGPPLPSSSSSYTKTACIQLACVHCACTHAIRYVLCMHTCNKVMYIGFVLQGKLYYMHNSDIMIEPSFPCPYFLAQMSCALLNITYQSKVRHFEPCFCVYCWGSTQIIDSSMVDIRTVPAAIAWRAAEA